MSDDRKIEIVDINGIMSTKGGRMFINRVLDCTGVFHDSYNSDTHEHAKNAGRRQVGLWILNELKESGDYLKLIKERKDDE